MLSLYRGLVLAVALISAGAPGLSSAAMHPEENGPRSKASVDTQTTFKPANVSLAPKTWVADAQPFLQLESHAAGLAGPNGPGKPAIDRYVAGHAPEKRGSSIAVDTD